MRKPTLICCGWLSPVMSLSRPGAPCVDKANPLRNPLHTRTCSLTGQTNTQRCVTASCFSYKTERCAIAAYTIPSKQIPPFAECLMLTLSTLTAADSKVSQGSGAPLKAERWMGPNPVVFAGPQQLKQQPAGATTPARHPVRLHPAPCSANQ
ncbi:hypothetical protein LX36DRAFT_22724 [Colletotrichum falcatum]|nr:hypothetical protein LX36DRAFT_22724 [Colletotrichum falcatum]